MNIAYLQYGAHLLKEGQSAPTSQVSRDSYIPIVYIKKENLP